MYEVIQHPPSRNKTEQLELKIAELYVDAERSSVSGYNPPDSVVITHANVVTPRVPQWQQTDHLRHFTATHTNGYLFDLKFSHCELVFANALMQFNTLLGLDFLNLYPDLSELLVRQFRSTAANDGKTMGPIPVKVLNAYAQRWQLPVWQVVRAFKVAYQSLQLQYQTLLQAWAARPKCV